MKGEGGEILFQDTGFKGDTCLIRIEFNFTGQSETNLLTKGVRKAETRSDKINAYIWILVDNQRNFISSV